MGGRAKLAVVARSADWVDGQRAKLAVEDGGLELHCFAPTNHKIIPWPVGSPIRVTG